MTRPKRRTRKPRRLSLPAPHAWAIRYSGAGWWVVRLKEGPR